MLQGKLRKQRRLHSVPKSNTTVALPTILKTISQMESQNLLNKSSYLDFAQNISDKINYEAQDTHSVEKQHNQLRTILKKMNNDALHIINKLRPKKNRNKLTKQQLSTLTDHQVENSRKLIFNLQYQITKLKQKYSRLAKYEEQQKILQKIKQVKLQIENLKSSNLQNRLNVQKQGKSIVKEYALLSDPRLSNLEDQAHLGQQKFQKLQIQTKKVQEQLQNISNKLQQTDPTLLQLQTTFKIIVNQQNLNQSQKNRLAAQTQKKRNLEHLKKRIQYQISYAKHKYYNLLKQFDQQEAIHTAIQTKIHYTSEKLSQSKRQSEKLDQILKQIKKNNKKKGRVVMQYLANQKMQKNINNNASIKQFTSHRPEETIKPSQASIEYLQQTKIKQKTEPTTAIKDVTQQNSFRNKDFTDKKQLLFDLLSNQIPSHQIQNQEYTIDQLQKLSSQCQSQLPLINIQVIK